MNSIELRGIYNAQQGKLIQTLAAITENNMMYEEGKVVEKNGELQIKIGKNIDEHQHSDQETD
jgi:uncharacterized protein YjbJ (UPF0337 family)